MRLLDHFRSLSNQEPRAIHQGDVVRFRKLTPTARSPIYSTPGAAGMDVFADEYATVLPQRRRRVLINIAIELPWNMQAQMLPRSGLALKRGITLLNSPGLIDPDYRGPLSALLYNTSQEAAFEVLPGDRIAQLVIMPFVRANMIEVEELSDTERGAGGWGSTGKR